MDKLTPQNVEQEYMIQILLAKMQGIEVQILNSIGDWSISTRDVICIDSIYRIKSHELPITKEMWAMIGEEWKWAAMDEEGDVWFYKEKPYNTGECWHTDSWGYTLNILAIDTDRIDWRKSLTKRPEGV
ncbi:hypothetical protein J3U66_04480 [Gilliamella sp. B2969]|uniref:hypothetical protein n=1 Tax=Gilliamella sp. B2969 TaxID=2818021 RepID=UPI002269BEA0|nr:hypothetical protein [Gilliamella sp. B2969]MCX8729630.1 hypothetical protein [Gilliamella sp. B2969]